MPYSCWSTTTSKPFSCSAAAVLLRGSPVSRCATTRGSGCVDDEHAPCVYKFLGKRRGERRQPALRRGNVLNRPTLAALRADADVDTARTMMPPSGEGNAARSVCLRQGPARW